MSDPIRELKTRARLLLRRVRDGDSSAVARLEPADGVQLAHCLAAVAREAGFSGWQHAAHLLGGDAEPTDFGTGLCPTRCVGFVNHWFADYDEARACRDRTGGYLLGFRRQFVVVTADYLRALGLDPDDPDWAAIDRDWVRPGDAGARTRLWGRLLAGQPHERPG